MSGLQMLGGALVLAPVVAFLVALGREVVRLGGWQTLLRVYGAGVLVVGSLVLGAWLIVGGFQ